MRKMLHRIKNIHIINKSPIYRINICDYVKHYNKKDRRYRIMNINNLYNLTLFLLGGCMVSIIVTITYLIGIFRYAKKERMLEEKMQYIEIREMESRRII